jgi:hypothetical protein
VLRSPLLLPISTPPDTEIRSPENVQRGVNNEVVSTPPNVGGGARISNEGLQQPITSLEANMPPVEPNSFDFMRQQLEQQQKQREQEADMNAVFTAQGRIGEAQRLKDQQEALKGQQFLQAKQEEMFGNPEPYDLPKEEMNPAVQKPATGEDMQQGALDIRDPLQLTDDTKLAPGLDVNPVKGDQMDMFGPDLKLDPNAKLPKLPADSLYEQARRDARDAAVENDPRVQKASDTLTKAQELYLRVADQFHQGRIGEPYLRRIERDLKAFEDSLEIIKQQVADELNMNARKSQEIKSTGPLSRQRGAVDITPLRIILEKTLDALRKFDIPFVKDALERFDMSQSAKVFSDAMKSAKADGAPPEVIKALGDAYDASVQHTLGNMENALDRRGKRIPPGPKPGGPKSQRGYILLEGKKQRAVQNLTNKLDIETKLQEAAPSHWTVDQAMDFIKKAQDLNQNTFQNLMNFLTKGGQYLALKTHNPLIRFVVERFLTQDRLAKASVRDWIYDKETGLAAAMRRMTDSEQATVWNLVDLADLHQKPIDLTKMATRGLNAAQVKFIEMHRKAMDYALQQINKARANAGLDPVSPRVAYAAFRATGDFRAVVRDQKGGNVVGVISSNFRPRLNALKEKMLDKGFYVDEPKYFGGMPRERGSANEAFMHAIEVLADKDPKVADFVDVLNQIRTSEINNFLNMKRHTMAKKGVFGMEGRKFWEDAEQNAHDGLQAQLNYLEGAIKWGHLSEAFRDAKAVIDHADSAHMPMARKWAERYTYHALGFNPSEVGRAVEDTIARMFKEMGVGYSIGRTTMAKARYLTNSLLLTMNPRFWYTNVVQPLMAMPGMKADLIARGLDAGFDFGTGYTYIAQAANTAVRINAKVDGMTPFEKALDTYARKYHVYGSDMVEHSNRVRKDAGYYIDQMNDVFAGTIESATRRVMFNSFAHMLQENGMSIKNGLFEAAHNLTDMSMNNYSSLERPQMYNSLGPVGDLAVNLKSYTHNELSRVALFVRDSKEFSSIRPIAADLLARFAFGGVMGMLGYDTVDALFHMISKMTGHPMSLSNLVFRASEGANKIMYDKTGGKVDSPYLMSNGIHSLIGIDMSRSLGLTDVVPNSVGEALFPGGSKLAQGASSLYDLTSLPGSNGSGMSEMNLKRAALANSPVFLQGYLNNKFFTRGEGDNRVALRPRDLKVQAFRDDHDYAAKSIGFSGLNESVQRQKNFNVERMSRDYADLRQGPLNSMRDTLFSNKGLDPKDVSDYIKYRGNVMTLIGDLQRYAEEQRLTPEQLAYMKASASSAVGAKMKALDYANAFKK